MKTGDYISIKTFDGGTMEGFFVNHCRELPKSAKLDTYTYDENYQSYARYVMYGKSKTKYYLRKSI